MKGTGLLSMFIGLAVSVQVQAKKELNVPTIEFVPGEFVVKLKDPSLIENNFAIHSLASSGSRIIDKKTGLVLIKRNMLETQSYSLNSLNESPAIEYAEPNYIYRANNLPNDPMLGQLWGLINEGQNVSARAGRVGVDVDAERAWQIQTGSRDVVVAVIDTGVDYDLADLNPNMWTNDAELNGQAGVDDDGNGYIDDIYGYDFANNDANPMDDHGHGSHCSGTIGGKGNDEVGVVGVAWNVRIMALKFLKSSGGGTLEGAIQSINYAANNGAHIMSNSWGGGGYSKALEDAIQAASDKGILFVAAAGNHNANNDLRPTYPANYGSDNVISVAAIDNSGQMASFTCYGKETVDIAAPGVDILSTTPGGFKSWSGTSMATPHVSGVAALVLSNEPNISMRDLKERLISTSKPLGALRNRVLNGGIVNAYHALTNTMAPEDPFDPFHWPKIDESFETEHPYSDNAKIRWEIRVEGAEMISVHFARFETESGYDKVTFKNAEGEAVAVLSGNHDDAFSPVVMGDTMIMEFTSDVSMNKYGFQVDKVAAKYTSSGTPVPEVSVTRY